MDTLADIMKLGEDAAKAGNPITDNWPQMRGALLMLGYAGGGLDQVRIADFEARFPDDFGALDPATQTVLPSARAYEQARHQSSRLLASLGKLDDPWEQLRMLIRRSGLRDAVELHWGGLMTPAREAGLAPADIRTDWVWQLNAEREGGFRRQRLRRAATLFNRLFNIPEIVESGLLPHKPIGSPPVYDRQGRDICDLPPTLAGYQAVAFNAPGGGLPQVWQVMCVSGDFDMPEDPKADDLLARNTWQRITQLRGPVTGVSDGTWQQYIGRTRRILLPHATLPVPEHLPDWLEALIVTQQDSASLKALWRLMWERDMVNATPDELLRLETWREMWREAPKIAARTWSTYEGRARKLMVKHANDQSDPYRIATRAWADLPAGSKRLLNPIRKSAERALMRPLDLTPEWVANQGLKLGLSPRRSTQVTEALRVVFFSAAQVRQPDPVPNPAERAWKALRSAFKMNGLSPRGIGAAENRALDDGLSPADLTPDWAAKTAVKIEHRRRPEFAKAVRLLDEWREHMALAPLLYTEALSPLPDFRKGAKIEPPPAILREVDAITDALQRKAPTRREARATVRKVWTAASKTLNNVRITTLEELLLAANALDLDGRTRRKSANLLADLRSMSDVNVVKTYLDRVGAGGFA
ncbi:hypothetical protein [Mameliella sp.]|uniref:hypothetical protein n=1 Tax=Mameliella sp. TaxID=1924940 RepID=UPI003BAB8A50